MLRTPETLAALLVSSKAPLALLEMLPALIKALRLLLEAWGVETKTLQVPSNLLQDLVQALQYWSDSLPRPRHCSSASWGSAGVKVQTGEGCEWKWRKNSWLTPTRQEPNRACLHPHFTARHYIIHNTETNTICTPISQSARLRKNVPMAIRDGEMYTVSG